MTHPKQALVHGEIAPVAVQKLLKHRRRVVLTRLEQQHTEPQHPLRRRLSSSLVLMQKQQQRRAKTRAAANEYRESGDGKEGKRLNQPIDQSIDRWEADFNRPRRRRCGSGVHVIINAFNPFSRELLRQPAASRCRCGRDKLLWRFGDAHSLLVSHRNLLARWGRGI